MYKPFYSGGVERLYTESYGSGLFAKLFVFAQENKRCVWQAIFLFYN